MSRKNLPLIVCLSCCGLSAVGLLVVGVGIAYAVLTERQAAPNETEQRYSTIVDRAQVEIFPADFTVKRPIVAVLDGAISADVTRRFGDAGADLKQESQAWNGTSTRPLEEAKTVVWIKSYSPKGINIAYTSGDNQAIVVEGYAYWDVTLIDVESQSIVNVRSKRFTPKQPGGGLDDIDVDAVVSYVLGIGK